MADRYGINLTARAEADLARIHRYLERAASRDVAAEVIAGIIRATRELEHLPGRFKQEGISRSRRTPVRMTMSDPYLIYYRIDEATATVFVFSVRHGSQERLRDFP